MVHSDRRPSCERGGRILVRFRELAGPLLRQVTPGSAADDYRHAEERAHRRMLCGKPGGARVGGHVGQPERSWVSNQCPKDTTTAGPSANCSLLVLGEPVSDEALEFATLFVEDPDCGVLRTRNRSRRLQQPVQHCVEIELGNQCRAERDQLAQPVDLESFARIAAFEHASDRTSGRRSRQ